MSRSRKIVTDDELEQAVKNSISVMGVLRFLGLKTAGGSHSYYSKRIRTAKLDISHFKGKASNYGKISATRKSADQILILRESGNRAKAHMLTRSMLEK